MLSITFKNVGQGDSILLEWINNNQKHYGIIDCKIHDYRNPVLEEIKKKQVTHIDFIILSHLHNDHYSGLSDLLKYCIQNNIVIDNFLHTFSTEFTRILEIILISQREIKNANELLEIIDLAINKNIIINIDAVTHKFKPINLFNDVNLQFLSPNGKDSFDLSKQRAKFDNNISNIKPDFNIMSTIILISSAANNSNILLTADSTVKNFERIIDKVKGDFSLIQVPHHGSANNLNERFWTKLNKNDNCSSVYSVGDVLRDKLPKVKVVEFFHNEKYFNQSTNYVYGIVEFYSATSMTMDVESKIAKTNRKYLSIYGKPKLEPVDFLSQPRFSGDQSFIFDFL